jgi:hypothetical protein
LNELAGIQARGYGGNQPGQIYITFWAEIFFRVNRLAISSVGEVASAALIVVDQGDRTEYQNSDERYAQCAKPERRPRQQGKYFVT